MAFRQPGKRFRPTRRERGSTLVEFCIVSVIWVPILVFLSQLGLDAVRALTATQVCRDAGHMFAYGVNFSQQKNTPLLVKMMTPLNISSGSGDGCLVLSTIVWVTKATCSTYATNNCQNAGHYAFTSFTQFGNTAADVMYTKMGNPPTGYITGVTTFGTTDFITNAQLRADGLLQYLPTPDTTGQTVFVSELVVRPLISNGHSNGSYNVSIF